MTVKELTEVMDKSIVFTVHQAGHNALMFDSTEWNKTNYTMKSWEEVGAKEVVQFTPNLNGEEVSIYVSPHCVSLKKSESTYEDGIYDTIYELGKELDIPNQDIRESGKTVDEICSVFADRIRDLCEENQTEN